MARPSLWRLAACIALQPFYSHMFANEPSVWGYLIPSTPDPKCCVADPPRSNGRENTCGRARLAAPLLPPTAEDHT